MPCKSALHPKGRAKRTMVRGEPNETHQKAKKARGMGSTGRDSGFALARLVL